MELIIGLAVLAVAGYFVFFRQKDEPLVTSAPYKVDTPPAPAAEPEAVVVVENAVVPEAVVAEAPAKKPRKPRAPKVEQAPVKAVKAKAPVAKTTKAAVAKTPVKAVAKAPVKKPAARTAAKSKKA